MVCVRNGVKLGILTIFIGATFSLPNKFGIGCYTDTQGSPPLGAQLDATVTLAGSNGWVVLYLCAWRDAGRSCMNASTTRDPVSEVTLRSAYSRGLRVVARIGNPYIVRDHADDAGSTGNNAVPRVNYTSLAAAYARVIGSLPPPPGGTPLYVHIGNEFNACNEWRCRAAPPALAGAGVLRNMSGAFMAREVAAFSRDVAAALAPLRRRGGGRGGWAPGQLQLAHAPVANWQTPPCRCGDGAALGKAGNVGLQFLQNMLDAAPQLYSSEWVDWLASHSYPFSMAPWGDASGKALRGLTYYRNESATVRPQGPDLPTILTETGWRRRVGVIDDMQQANWTALAFEALWLPDAAVIGIAPFLLAGHFWEPMGWPWANATAAGALAPRPVFMAIKRLRCKVMIDAGCQ